MKVSPVVGTGAPAGANVGDGRSASTERIQRAVAVAAGQAPSEAQTQEKPSEEKKPDIKKIVMRTQRSTNRHETPGEASVAAAQEAVTPESNTLAPVEQAQPATEATQPVSPDVIALAKAKRALQAKEREIAAREAALVKPSESAPLTKEQIQEALSGGLREGSLTWDDLTQWVTSLNQGTPGLDEVRAEIKALKQGFEKSQTDRDAAQEQQVLNYIEQDVNQLVDQGDDYAMIREEKAQKSVVKLIQQVFKTEGKMLDTDEAAKEVENILLEDALTRARIPKVQSRLTPAQVQQLPPAKQSGPNTKIMRTLTNRDGATPVGLNRRERAIAAAEGRLK